MKKLTILKSAFLVVAITCLFIAQGLFFVGGNAMDKTPEQEITVTLDKKSVALEKNESILLEAVVNDETAVIEWSSLDTSVATVENGLVTAVGEGYTVVSAAVGEKSAKCSVRVYDNGLVMAIKTNADGEDLNLMVGSSFGLSYTVTYNKKEVSAELSVRVLDDTIASVSDKGVTAKKLGSTQIVIEAVWNGMKAVNVINLNVVSDFIADYGVDEIKLFNDPRAGATEYVLTPTLIESGTPLGTGDYEVFSASFDDEIISFDVSSLKITGVGKGTTELKVVYKSELTDNTVTSAVSVTVDLYTQDKSNAIKLSDVYIDEGGYEINPDEAFADLSAEERKDLYILAAEDVTGSAKRLTLSDGVVDTSGFISGGIVGERLWKVQCRKYSYIVKVNVSDFNAAEYLVGRYLYNDEYEYELLETNDVRIYNAETKNLETYGQFRLYPIDKKNGKIKITLNDRFLGDTVQYGVYTYGKSMRLTLQIGRAYSDMPSLSDGPYYDAAGVYSSNSWFVGIKLNGDRTFVLDGDDAYGLRGEGKYTLTPKDAASGEMTLTVESGSKAGEVFTGTYAFDGDGYSFGVTYNGKTHYFTQKDKAAAKAEKSYDGFGGGYTSRGTLANGATGQWCTFYFAPDGTMIFDIYIESTISSMGRYTLKGDENSGIIEFDIEKAYCGNTHFEGTYEFDEAANKYVLKIEVEGSGYTDLTFTQLK